MKLRLDNKIAIVLGAGQTPGTTMGNGRATALRYAQEGATVVVADRELTRARQTSELITKDGGKALARSVDVQQEEDVRELIDGTLARFGRIDIAHYNVGISIPSGDEDIESLSAEDFTLVSNINLRGAALMAKYAVPIMKSQKKGAIVYIGSNSALIDHPNVAYKTSKAGLISLAQHLAIRHAREGIRVNVVVPGLINTPMAVEKRVRMGGQPRDKIIADRISKVPLAGRGGTAWDVANAALFLASPEADFITGTTLVVDGGQFLNAG